MENLKAINLCMPDREKSCFACCPPIRPKGYEHIQYKNIIKRMLRENTSSFAIREKPIIGFSCWALGYLDKEHKLIGCLLHPYQNKGKDLRDLTGYGEKCRREYCLEARIFSELNLNTKLFLLNFSEGMDSFSYSSRRYNPVFKLLRWGREILEYIANKENYTKISLERLRKKYPFLNTDYDPRAAAYIVKTLLGKGKIIAPELISRLFYKLRNISEKYHGSETYIHLLPLDRDFLDFLRLGIGIKKSSFDKIIELKMLISSYL